MAADPVQAGLGTSGHGNGSDAKQTSAAKRRRRRELPRLSIVVPTKNEAGNIAKLIERVEETLNGVPAEILFVDDSSDDTVEAIEAARAHSTRDIVVIHRDPGERAGGLGGAVVAGMRAARGEWVCVMDADLQHPPEVIPRLLDRADGGGADLVVASRYSADEAVDGFGRVRSAVSRVSTTLARGFFPMRLRGVTDPLSGFFLVRRTAVDLDRLRPRGFKILLEILARSSGLRTAEVAFEFGRRYAGKSKASVREGLRYVAQLCSLRAGESLATFARFGFVGASGLVVNLLAFAACTSLLGLHYLAAAAVSTQASTLWNFLFTELWVFSGRPNRRSQFSRLAMFFAMNNGALLLRGPMLVLLITSLRFDSLLANLISLLALTVIRFGLADSWIWGGTRPQPATVWHSYDIHGVVTVASEVALPELARFRVEQLPVRPTIRVRIGKLNRVQSELVGALAFLARHTRYDEGLGRCGFGIEIAVGKTTQVLASPLLKRSPHVLYTNVVEPILRWNFVKKGYALVHAACIAFDDQAFLVTAKTDTGKTTTILKTLDNHRCSFLSDDLTLIAPDGRALTYAKPLTISRHTVSAVNTPLLSRLERFWLVFQSRLHSRSGRRFAFLLSRTHLPIATINAVVQALVPPPKYHIDRLVPQAELKQEARLAGLVIIERGGEGHARLAGDEAVEILMSNCEDAYGFPPYPTIAPFLHSGNGRDLRAEERAIVASALDQLPATLLRSSKMDWWTRLPAVVNRTLDPDRAAPVVPLLAPALPLAFE